MSEYVLATLAPKSIVRLEGHNRQPVESRSPQCTATLDMCSAKWSAPAPERTLRAFPCGSLTSVPLRSTFAPAAALRGPGRVLTGRNGLSPHRLQSPQPSRANWKPAFRPFRPVHRFARPAEEEAPRTIAVVHGLNDFALAQPAHFSLAREHSAPGHPGAEFFSISLPKRHAAALPESHAGNRLRAVHGRQRQRSRACHR